MSLLEAAVYYAWVFGFTYVICQSTITLPLRTWLAERGNWSADEEQIPEDKEAWLSELIDCPACLSWWVGLIVGPVLAPLGPLWYQRLEAAAVLSFATSGAVLFLQRISGLSKG